MQAGNNIMIKAIIFDLNGIFLQSEKLSVRFERDFGVPASKFLPKLHEIVAESRKLNAKASFLFWEPVLKDWGLKINEDEFWQYWFSGEKPSEKMINYSRNLKQKGLKIFILSNNFKERANYYDHYPWIHEAVDKVYFSWQTGYVKPDVRAWQLVLEENNLKGEECIYFDDKKENIIASESLGIKSFLFTNEEELENIINNLI